MQMISEVMTRDVRFVSPQETLQQAAQIMNDLNVGVLPVCDGDQLVGMITDRDITVRSTAGGVAPTDTCVQDAMSADVRWCFEDQSVDEVMQQMADSQIRRVPVISHDEAHRLIGIVALGDLATRTDESQKPEVEQVVKEVSSPSEPERKQEAPGAGTGGAGGAATAGTSGSAYVGAPGAAIAPGSPAGDRDTFGSGPPPENTGKGRQGRVGDYGDPGGFSPADMAEQQRAAGQSPGKEGAAGGADIKRDAGAAGGAADAGADKPGGTTGTGGTAP